MVRPFIFEISVHPPSASACSAMDRGMKLRTFSSRRPSFSTLITTRPRSEETRLNSSHQIISYAVFCLKKKKAQNTAPIIYLTSVELLNQLDILLYNEPSLPSAKITSYDKSHTPTSLATHISPS